MAAIIKFSYYTINIFMLQFLSFVSVTSTYYLCPLEIRSNTKLRKVER